MKSNFIKKAIIDDAVREKYSVQNIYDSIDNVQDSYLEKLIGTMFKEWNEDTDNEFTFDDYADILLKSSKDFIEFKTKLTYSLNKAIKEECKNEYQKQYGSELES